MGDTLFFIACQLIASLVLFVMLLGLWSLLG